MISKPWRELQWSSKSGNWSKNRESINLFLRFGGGRWILPVNSLWPFYRISFRNIQPLTLHIHVIVYCQRTETWAAIECVIFQRHKCLRCGCFPCFSGCGTATDLNNLAWLWSQREWHRSWLFHLSDFKLKKRKKRKKRRIIYIVKFKCYVDGSFSKKLNFDFLIHNIFLGVHSIHSRNKSVLNMRKKEEKNSHGSDLW